MNILSLLLLFFCPVVDEDQTPIYQNPSYSYEERAVDLVSRLTLEEKESLLGNNMAAIPRLEVNQYNLWSEALHGVLGGPNPNAGLQGPTSYPNSVATGSSWDPQLLEREAAAISDEARATFQASRKGLTFWSPVVEPIRDPRWGRTGESYGEDPYLSAVMSGAFVRGFMGSDPDYIKAVPCAKHYFANNSEFDRHVSSSNMDSRDMREFYLYPYKELIENDNLPSIMSSYNAVNGVPTSASVLYLDSIARRTYGMKGYVTGDCAAIEDIYTGHYYVETAEEATAAGLKAGVDSDCGSVYQRAAINAYNQGLLTMADIDRALVNVFTIRMRTGEFDPDPMVPYALYPASTVNAERYQALAEEIATRTPVLLKDEVVSGTDRKALPVDASQIRSIALIGPQADRVELGPYSGRPEESSRISPYKGISEYLAAHNPEVEVRLASGGSTKSKSNLLYVGYFELTKADGTVTRYDATKFSSSSEGITVGSGMGTEEQIRSIDDGSWTAYDNIDLVDVDKITIGANIPTEGGIIEVHVDSPSGNLISTIEATKASGKPVGGVYGTSTPMDGKVLRLGINELKTLYLVYKAPADDEIDESILKTARESDVAIVFVGTDEKTATEEADRLTLDLPGNQLALIKAVAAQNKNTIVVMQTLGCVEVDGFKDLENIPGILWTGYNGQAQGKAIAKILFGDANPGGKLNATWYRSVKDLPAITDYTLRGGAGKNGRTLWYFDKPVSYEFGYGLSYTTFEYSNFRISSNAITPSDKVTVSVDVKNTGSYDGDEVVQLYVSTPDSPASAQRPIKRLKGFQRVTIPIGQTKTVDIEVDCEDLWFWDMDSDRIAYDSGRYVFEIGSSSKDIRGTVTATMDGSAFVPELKTVVADCGTFVMRIGETAQTSYTACMTDDAFISTDLTKAVYRSNNEAVIAVDENGKITATGQGVATVTVAVTVDGKTVCGEYSVKVMPNLVLSSLKVGGKSVLKKGVTSYSFLRKASATAPVITAEVNDPSLDVVIEQAQAVPGTAIVKVIDPVTSDMECYYVNFGVKAVSDEFRKEPSQAWTIMRENKEGWNPCTERWDGALSLTTETGDLTGSSNNVQNLFLQSANSDWTIDTRVAFSALPGRPAQNAGIVAYQDDDNFVKYIIGYQNGRREVPGGIYLQIICEENGYTKPTVGILVKEDARGSQESWTNNVKTVIGRPDAPDYVDEIWLRFQKKGSMFTAFYSYDGKTYHEAGYAEAELKDIQAGLIACDGVAPAFGGGFRRNAQAQEVNSKKTVWFDMFRIRCSGL